LKQPLPKQILIQESRKKPKTLSGIETQGL